MFYDIPGCFKMCNIYRCIIFTDGSVGRYLGIESILLKYYDEILQPPLCLSAHIMEVRVKILETYPKSEEIRSFYPQFSGICRIHTVLAVITLCRTAMFWLREFITSILLVSSYN